MLWDEMSYRKFTQSGKDVMPDVWDNIYSPKEETFLEWIYCDNTYVFNKE